MQAITRTINGDWSKIAVGGSVIAYVIGETPIDFRTPHSTFVMSPGDTIEMVQFFEELYVRSRANEQNIVLNLGIERYNSGPSHIVDTGGRIQLDESVQYHIIPDSTAAQAKVLEFPSGGTIYSVSCPDLWAQSGQSVINGAIGLSLSYTGQNPPSIIPIYHAVLYSIPAATIVHEDEELMPCDVAANAYLFMAQGLARNLSCTIVHKGGIVPP